MEEMKKKEEKIPMPDPNIDTTKLREISKVTAKLKRIVDEYRSKGYSYRTVSVNLDDIDTIAQTVLAQQKKIKELEDFCENEVLAVKGVQIDYEKMAIVYKRIKAARQGERDE